MKKKYKGKIAFRVTDLAGLQLCVADKLSIAYKPANEICAVYPASWVLNMNYQQVAHWMQAGMLYTYTKPSLCPKDNL